MADISSTTWDVNYESTKYSVNNTSSGSISIKVREIERILFRSPSGREFLYRQEEGEKEPIEVVSEIPSKFLAGEETCTQYVASVLSSSTTAIESSIQHRVVSNISKDTIDISRILREKEKEKGFLIKADVEVVKETSYNGFVHTADYDNKGRRKPIEQECKVCLEEMSNGRIIMKLLCSHNFHRNCILKWLRRKHSCPTCCNDINTRPPRKQPKPGEVSCFTVDDYSNWLPL